MPDFNIECHYHCNSAQYFSTEVDGSNGKKYTVKYCETPRGFYEYDYICDCHSFKFGKGKHCKHIEQVKDSGKHCGWMQFIHGGEPVEKNGVKTCPKCGDECGVARYAV